MMSSIDVTTDSRTTLVDITSEVERLVGESEVRSGICYLYVPHTTAAITVNENADPSVRADILKEVNKVIPFNDKYSHLEGNAAAHIKSTLIGVSRTIPVEKGRLCLGTWQGIFFCEFDGPRRRKVLVKVLGD